MINLDSLNPPQRQAVEQTDGPILVLAGAGSGKTRVLTFRIAFILDSGLAGADNILAMTFTNKAAGEMKERIINLLKEVGIDHVYDMPWMGTFHSICVKILKKHGYLLGLSKYFTIYDSADQISAVKEAMNQVGVSTKEFNPNAIHNYISSAKNELISTIDYESFSQGYFQQTVAKVYPKYQEIIKNNNAVDFDDLLFLTVKLFRDHPEVLETYQNQFKYILVDEYQDTNHAQYVIVNMLAQKYRNICCVGDDDQSIYSFRGATIKNILSFEKDYSEAQIIKLEQNYRSTKKILEASHQVISKNEYRKDKKLWTDNTDGENITIYTAKSETDESNWVTDKIEDIAKGKYKDVAILYRTNSQSRTIEEAMLRASIPYRIIGGVRFYERKEVKDILAYLRCVYNLKDDFSAERIINVPRRGIGPKTIEETKDLSKQEGLSILEYLGKQRILLPSKLKEFIDLIEIFEAKSKELNVADLINYILDVSGYLAMLKDGTLENESRIDNLKELISVASKYENLEPQESLEQFLQEVSLLEGNPESVELDNSVTLMTIHASKGLEFEYVFVVGMEENLFPHSRSALDSRELEEERRLAYVAITRAKKKLFLTHAVHRVYFGSSQNNPISRFILDIDKELIEHHAANIVEFNDGYDDYKAESSHTDSFYKNVSLQPGDYVKHEYFGKGKVIKINDEEAVVDFGSVYGVKELMLEYARLEKL